MVVSCCAFGCTNRHGQREGLRFFRFPSKPVERRQKWIIAVKRKNWQPSKHTRICGDHFVSGLSKIICAYAKMISTFVTVGRPVDAQGDVDYVPTVFKFSREESDAKKKRKEARKARFNRRRQRADIMEVDRANQEIAAEALLLLQSSETHHDVSTQTSQCSLTDTGMQTVQPTYYYRHFYANLYQKLQCKHANFCSFQCSNV